MIRFIDLFAGIGGIRLGFDNYKRDKNTKCVFASEWDKFAQKTYQANFGIKPSGDITKIPASRIPRFDVLLAGFPCQPFSTIGKRKGFKDKTQGTLFFDILRIIRYHHPKAFLLENVPGLLSSQNGYTFKVIKNSLQKSGYQFFYHILQASDFGLPQSRKRLIMVGFRNDINCKNFKYPTGNGVVTPVWTILQAHPKKYSYSITKHLQHTYLFKKDDGHPYIISRDIRDNKHLFAKTLNASYHKIQRVTGTFVKDGKTGLRLLTQLECERLQGFAPCSKNPKYPDCPINFKFKFPVSRTQMYRQLGNSVAIPMIRAVSDKIKEILKVNY